MTFKIKLSKSFFLRDDENLLWYKSLQLDFIFWYWGSSILDKLSKIFAKAIESPALVENPKLLSLIKKLVSQEIKQIIGTPLAKYVWNLAGTVLENKGLLLSDK